MLLLASALGAVAGPAVGASSRPVPGTSCPAFPADNVWHADVSRLPVHARSAQWLSHMSPTRRLHPDFGGATYGIPITVVDGTHARVPVSFDYADESDAGPYPLGADTRIEGGSDRHTVVVDRDACRLYETWATVQSGGRWSAGSGAIWDLRSNRLRQKGYTSADAAGLPILPGLARYHEVRRGRIDHALRFTAPRTRRKYIYPATHFASDSDDPALPAMGQRFRLRADYPIGRFPRQARVVLAALKRYGMILADNGSAWYVSGAPHRRWDNDALHTLHDVPGRAFEAVDTSRLPRP